MQRPGGADVGDCEHEGKVRVTIRRDDPGSEGTFLVDRTEPMLVLDLLLAVRREQDPTLAFRHSCRVAMCNTCGVRVDGEPVLACRVPVLPERNDLLIQPLEEVDLRPVELSRRSPQHDDPPAEELERVREASD